MFRNLLTTPEFNTQLSLVSIVGSRGVGKSTVASLLSGNSSMFVVGSGSIGTTTTGADISTVIPSSDWAATIKDKIGITVNAPAENLPLFLIDSEGMGVRGATFDFITTSPPAVIAKVIIWIGVENLQTAKILEEIQKYLHGLDNIVMEEDKIRGGFCSTPSYGHFVVVINKMMGSTPDDLLQRELMEPEPDYIEGSTERNKIRQQLQECFDGITVHGLPTLTVTPGQPIDYPILDGRFKDGLGKIVTSVLERVEEARIVTVAGVARQLNATNAEVIIGTVIAQANKGQIDLTGFDSFWTYIKQDIIAKLGRAAQDFSPISNNCEQISEVSGYICSKCVCSYRNSLVQESMEEVQEELELAASQAESMFGVDVEQDVGEFYNEFILPWEAAQTCTGEQSGLKVSSGVCDISQLSLDQPGQTVDIPCDMLLLCGSSVMNAREIHITANSMFVSPNTKLETASMSKAQEGSNGDNAGESGGQGSHGASAGSMTLNATKKLKSSADNIIFTSKGQDGGAGGNGAVGKDNTGVRPDGPNNAREVNGPVQITLTTLTPLPSVVEVTATLMTNTGTGNCSLTTMRVEAMVVKVEMAEMAELPDC